MIEDGTFSMRSAVGKGGDGLRSQRLVPDRVSRAATRHAPWQPIAKVPRTTSGCSVSRAESQARSDVKPAGSQEQRELTIDTVRDAQPGRHEGL